MNAIKQIKQILQKEPIITAYLYGSQTRQTHPESDLDIAILPQNPQKHRHRYFAQKLLPVQSSAPLDIRLISPDHNPVFLSQVILHGKPIVVNNPQAKADFEVTALKKYYHIQPYLKLQKQKIKNYASTYDYK